VDGCIDPINQARQRPIVTLVHDAPVPQHVLTAPLPPVAHDTFAMTTDRVLHAKTTPAFADVLGALDDALVQVQTVGDDVRCTVATARPQSPRERVQFEVTIAAQDMARYRDSGMTIDWQRAVAVDGKGGHWCMITGTALDVDAPRFTPWVSQFNGISSPPPAGSVLAGVPPLLGILPTAPMLLPTGQRFFHVASAATCAAMSVTGERWHVRPSDRSFSTPVDGTHTVQTHAVGNTIVHLPLVDGALPDAVAALWPVLEPWLVSHLPPSSVPPAHVTFAEATRQSVITLQRDIYGKPPAEVLNNAALQQVAAWLDATGQEMPQSRRGWAGAVGAAREWSTMLLASQMPVQIFIAGPGAHFSHLPALAEVVAPAPVDPGLMAADGLTLHAHGTLDRPPHVQVYLNCPADFAMLRERLFHELWHALESVFLADDEHEIVSQAYRDCREGKRGFPRPYSAHQNEFGTTCMELYVSPIAADRAWLHDEHPDVEALFLKHVGPADALLRRA
jgi:hypothetical protein